VTRRMVCCSALVLQFFTVLLTTGSAIAQAQSRPAGQSQPYLIFSTYLGGTTPCDGCDDSRTFAQNAASDSQGNTYVTGATRASNLPVKNAFQPEPAPDSEMTAFVAKYDPSGQLLWLTYLGGNKQNMGIGVAVLPNDAGVAVSGVTSARGRNPFPTKNAFQENFSGGASDYFVAVFDAGGGLLYSTYLGGSGDDGNGFSDDNSSGNDLAADAHGLIYLAGTTAVPPNLLQTFPVTANAVQPVLSGATDAFLCILNPAKAGADSRVYCSFLGGAGEEKGHSVAVSAAGDLITVAGYTNSRDFPTTKNAYRNHPAPKGFTSNGYLAQFHSSKPGDPLSEYAARYVTYLGADSSEARDDVYGMSMTPAGIIVATGRTQSPDFPMTGPDKPSIYNNAPYLKPRTSGDQPYLVKLDPSLDGKASLVYATYLGGGDKDGQWGSFCTSLGVDAQGAAFVAGETNAPGAEYVSLPLPLTAPMKFPYTSNALIKVHQQEDDVEFLQISPQGAWFGYSTYLGGDGTDRAYGLAVDRAGNVVVTGVTSSDDFPLQNPAQPWPGVAGQENAFVSKFAFSGSMENGRR